MKRLQKQFLTSECLFWSERISVNFHKNPYNNFSRIGGLIQMPREIPTFQMVQNLSRPRFIKSHLPAFLLPDEIWKAKPKVTLQKRYNLIQNYEKSLFQIRSFMLLVTQKMLQCPFSITIAIFMIGMEI
jgi:hypothetical protein